MQSTDDGIIAIEEAAVLHDRRALLAHQVGTGADADTFLFPAKRHVNQIAVFFHPTQQVCEIDVRQRGDQIDSRALQSIDNNSRCV